MSATSTNAREQVQRLVLHVARRAMLLERTHEQRSQLAVMAGALVQALDDPGIARESTPGQLLNDTASPAEVRQLVQPLLSSVAIAGEPVFSEFVELLAAALMLERTSLGTDTARQIRLEGDRAQIAAVGRLGAVMDAITQRTLSADAADASSSQQPSIPQIRVLIATDSRRLRGEWVGARQ